MKLTRTHLGLLAAAALVAGLAPAMTSQAAGTPVDRESARLSQGLAAAVTTAGFDRLVDYDQPAGNGKAKPASFLPNADVAVIELTASGQIAGVANVLYDRDSPQGYRVDVDVTSLSARNVQFARWRQDRWDTSAGWSSAPATTDVLVQPTTADKQYMVAYPASVLKLMVAYSTLRLVDQGELGLDASLSFHDVDGASCGAAPSNPSGAVPAPVADGLTDTVRRWLDQMITVSDNFATCVLLQAIHDQGALDAENQHFLDLGLGTFRMRPQLPQVGSGWLSGTMTMGALDTTKLLLLISGAAGRLWTSPAGAPVSAASGLTAASRQVLLGMLAEQSFNEVLNPVNLCGSGDAVQGIPSTVSPRWVDGSTGNVVTYDGDLVIDFGYDTRPCQAAAQVDFAHKTGLTYNAGGDAGIVRALPGQDGRWYLVAALTSVGYRFGDVDWNKSKPNACEGSPYVCYSRAFGRLGGAVDALVKARPAAARS
jgi:Beta-lactamase enzyme family